MRAYQAAMKGAREIAFAIVAMTITLAAVYAPIAFQTGRTGRLFIEFALTLAGAVLVSGFVALSLSPMMCSLLLKHSERHNIVYRVIERGLNGLTAGYRRVLRLALVGAPCHRPGGAAGRRRRLRAVHPAPLRAVADRGPRHHPGHRQRARGQHDRLHRPLRPSDRGGAAGAAAGRARVRRDRLRQRRLAGDQLCPAGRLGPADDEAAGGDGQPGAQAVRHPGAPGLRHQPAIAGPERRPRSRSSSCSRPRSPTTSCRPAWSS